MWTFVFVEKKKNLFSGSWKDDQEIRVLSPTEVKLIIIYPPQSTGKAIHQSGNTIRAFNFTEHNQNTPFAELYCNTNRFIFFPNSKLL